jgi:photosystem II stability/assembly factor-like uncharacterized protein
MKRSCLVVAMLVLLNLLAFGAGAGERAVPEQAVASEQAARSLLLDVDRAGQRLVAVGHWGVVLSDDAVTAGAGRIGAYRYPHGGTFCR